MRSNVKIMRHEEKCTPPSHLEEEDGIWCIAYGEA